MAKQGVERKGLLHAKWCLHLWSVLLVIVVAVARTDAIAIVGEFNMEGFSGVVRLNQSEVGGRVVLEIEIRKESSDATWPTSFEFRNNWVDLSTDNKCASAGEKFGDIGAIFTHDSIPFVYDFTLPDIRSLIGRSLYLKSNSSSGICATLSLDTKDEYKYYVANVEGDVMGSIWFRYVEGAGLELLTNLYVKNKQKTKLRSYRWNILQEVPSSCGQIDTWLPYNPTNTGGDQCSTTDPANCAVGDLSGRLGNVSVGEEHNSERTLFRDTTFVKSSEVDITSRFIIVNTDENNIVGCSRIVPVNQRQSVVTFSNDGVAGTIEFSQASPYDQTQVVVDVNKLQNKAGGYHIHQHPVPYRALEDQKTCDAASVGGHFNPHGITSNPDPKTASLDMYEVGDLSGKFGTMANAASLSGTYTDSNLPMFGPNSIVGKSVVIHLADGGARWVCGNIVEKKVVVTAVATFKYPVSGYVLMRQIPDEEFAETSVFVSLDYTDGSEHKEFVVSKWEIHDLPVGYDSDAEEESSRCLSTGATYDPGTRAAGNEVICSTANHWGCPVGDLTRKLSNGVNTTGGKAAPKKFTFVDTNLPLSGPRSVVGRSVVIYGSGSRSSTRIACATIQPVKAREAKADQWSSDVTGFIEFSQASGVIHQLTDIRIGLEHLNKTAKSYHVHRFPVPKEGTAASPCSGKSVSGHFNPFNVEFKNSPPPNTGSNDQYEVGDLSGKFGLIVDKDTYEKQLLDANLNLFGLNSIVGRSIVIHRNDATTSRWVCASITEPVTSIADGTYIQASATFSESETTLTGYIRMGQYLYSDGSRSDTNVIMDLNYMDGKNKTSRHNWHVHVNAISGDGKADSKVCSSAGPHYNPYKVNVKTGYNECNPGNPLRCELGDQANKLGTYDIGGGKRVFTDIDLPLTGPYSVIGRSFVVHVPDRGAPRLACADIKAEHMPASHVAVRTPATLNRQDFLRKYATVLETSRWNLAVVVKDTGCLSVYFAGRQAMTLKGRFDDILLADPSKLGSFGVCGTSDYFRIQASTSLLVMCFCALLKLLW